MEKLLKARFACWRTVGEEPEDAWPTVANLSTEEVQIRESAEQRIQEICVVSSRIERNFSRVGFFLS